MGPNFTQAAAIYLPANSPLNHGNLTEGASSLLQTYEGVATKLNFVAWFGSYVFGLKALDTLRKTSMTVPHIDVKELKNAEPNLNEDNFIGRGVSINPPNDTEVEDESSSLLLLGPPNTEARFFQSRNYQGGEFIVQTGVVKDYAPFVAVRNFAYMNSEPSGRATIVKKFYGTGPPFFTPREISPNDQLSSFKWVK
jgi:hypothetical protein